MRKNKEIPLIICCFRRWCCFQPNPIHFSTIISNHFFVNSSKSNTSTKPIHDVPTKNKRRHPRNYATQKCGCRCTVSFFWLYSPLLLMTQSQICYPIVCLSTCVCALFHNSLIWRLIVNKNQRKICDNSFLWNACFSFTDYRFHFITIFFTCKPPMWASRPSLYFEESLHSSF